MYVDCGFKEMNVKQSLQYNKHYLGSIFTSTYIVFITVQRIALIFTVD